MKPHILILGAGFAGYPDAHETSQTSSGWSPTPAADC